MRRRRHDRCGRRGDLLAELARPPERVDFSAAIMARLGVPPPGSAPARRASLWRWGSRALLAALALGAVAGGVLLHARIERSGRPAGPTLPAAIRNDLGRHQHAISTTIQTIRQLQPRFPAPADDVAAPARPATPPVTATPRSAPAAAPAGAPPPSAGYEPVETPAAGQGPGQV